MFPQSLAYALLEHLAGASVRVLILAAVAAAMLAFFQPRAASVRHAVWVCVLLSMLALPFASSILPGWRVPAPAIVPAVMAERTPVRIAGAPIVIDVRDGVVTGHPAAAAPAERDWPRGLVGLYLAVAGALIIRFAVGLALTSRLADRAAPIRDERLRRILEEIAGEHGYGYPPPMVRETREMGAPAVAGTAILLPLQWRGWDDWKLSAVLAHEFTHVRRGDWGMRLAAAVNRCVFWFHPLAWWLEKQVAKLAELASDEAAAAITGDPVRYAELLLDVSAEARRAPLGRVAHAVLPMASAANLSGRVNRLLELRSAASGILPVKRRLAILALAIPCFLAIAAAQLSGPNLVAPRGDVAGTWQWQKDGFETSAEEAQRLEERLREQPGDLPARSRLIAYYFYQAQPEPLAGHVLYVIEHHPESALAGSDPVSAIYPRPIDPNWETKARLWREQATVHHSDARVQENAAQFLMQVDQEEAERLLERAMALAPENRRLKAKLAALYAEALRAASYANAGLQAIGRWYAVQPGFAASIEDKLKGATEADLVGTVGLLLAGGVRGSMEQRTGQQDQVVQARRTIAEHAERLLKRAQMLAPYDVRWPQELRQLESGWPVAGAAAADPPRGEGAGVRVPSAEQAQRLREGPGPEYPPLARQARIQGTVRLRITVNPEGRVAATQSVAGHPLLVPAAVEAVRKWVYAPAVVNGVPATVETMVDVSFFLARETPQSPPA